MLTFALSNKTKMLVHIDSVLNGKKADCICHGCGDILVAKNNCKDKSNHFSHQSLSEQKSCLMTQLHLVAQNYFLNVNKITIPEVNFNYKGNRLTHPAREIKVFSSKTEAPIDKYFADVCLETEIGQLVIEICVTHKTEGEKLAHYKKNKVNAIEYDLSRYRTVEIDVFLDEFDKNKAPYSWLYEWCREKLVDDCIARLDQEKKTIHKKRKVSAKKSASNLIRNQHVLLPSLNEKVSCEIQGHNFKDEIRLFTKKEIKLTCINLFEETEEYLILKGEVRQRVIWVAFLLVDIVPSKVAELDGSVVVRYPSSKENKTSVWEWLKYPSLDKNRAKLFDSFEANCLKEVKLEHSTKVNEAKASEYAHWYISSSDTYFNQDYQNWKRWMISKSLFVPSAQKKNPSIPKFINYYRNCKSLWMFDRWYVFTLSMLAELIDQKAVNTFIYFKDIFLELAIYIKLLPDFYELEKGTARKLISPEGKKLLHRESVIKEALIPFSLDGAVHILPNGFMRRRSLLDTLRVV